MSEQQDDFRHYPQHRENPRRPLVYQSPNKNGFWRAVVQNTEGRFECKVGRSLEEAYTEAVKLARLNAEAQQ